MLELEKAVKDIEKHLERSGSDFKKGWSDFNNAEKAYRKAEKLRDKIFQDTLKEKGLAVCSGFHFDGEEAENPTAEQLGVYPRDKMRLYYRNFIVPRVGRDEHGDVCSESFHKLISVKLYCPEHFPTDPDRIIDPESDKYKICSEIVKRGREFFLTVNNQKITKLVKEGDRDIEPDGKRYPNIAVYRHFGIPDLPEKPSFDRVKHSE